MTLECDWLRPQDHDDGDPEVFMGLRRERLACLPVFLQRANASTVLGALNASLPDLTLNDLVEFCKSTYFVVTQIAGDLAAVNTRVKHALAEPILEHNELAAKEPSMGCILLLDIQCVAHVLHRVVEAAFRTHILIPRLHSTAFVCSVPANSRLFALAVQRTLEADFASGGLFPHIKPPRAYRAHAEMLLQFTLLRPQATRGRDASEADARRMSERVALSQELLQFFNGDWRVESCQHFCFDEGCCGNRSMDAAVDRGMRCFNFTLTLTSLALDLAMCFSEALLIAFITLASHPTPPL